MKPSEIILGLLRIPIDFIMGLAAFALAYQIRSTTDLIPGVQLPLDLGSFPPFEEYLAFSATAVIALQILFAFNKLYSLKKPSKLSKEIGQVIIITSAWLLLIIAYYFIIREYPFSRLALAFSWLLTIILVSSGRTIMRVVNHILLQMGIGKTRLLFIGNNEITKTLIKSFSKNPKYKMVGLVDDHMKRCGKLKALGKVKELSKIIQKYNIEEIIQTQSDLPDAQATDLLDFCRHNQIEYSFVPDLLTVQKTNIEVETRIGIPIIKLKPTALDGWGRVLKRSFDIFGSASGLILLSPLFLTISLAIKLDSKGTVFFKFLDDGSRVKRVGLKGNHFHFYKFRTMYPNTHDLRYTQLADKNTRHGSPLVKIKDDPRVTKVGKFLRRTSLDEFPQLINVLRGSMSLVGPRPHLPEEVARYQKHHNFVFTIKPGITGLAQISGRSDLDFEEEVRLDSYYIENWSLWLDIKILLKTLLIPFKSYKE